MANQKLTDLSAVVTPVDTDLIYTVTDNGTTPTSKKGTWTVIKAFLKTYFDTLYPSSNVAIVGATKTKITYDAKGLVTAGEDATTADIAESANKKYITDAEKTAIGTIGDKAPSANPTFTGTVTLPKTVEIQDTSANHQYVLAVNELTADRTVTLPLLTGNDEFVFKDHTQTLTNKRITKRAVSTTDDATAVIDCDAYDDYYLTAIANATEISVTGTPTNGQTIFIGLKDAGVTKGLTWTGITGLGVTLPTDTTAGKQHIIGLKYIASAWRAIAVGVEA